MIRILCEDAAHATRKNRYKGFREGDFNLKGYREPQGYGNEELQRLLDRNSGGNGGDTCCSIQTLLRGYK